MRVEHTKWAFTVYFTKDDAESFSAMWPCSTVRGEGWFGYASNGDLIEMGQDGDGEDWAAFASDCKQFGLARRDNETLKVED